MFVLLLELLVLSLLLQRRRQRRHMMWGEDALTQSLRGQDWLAQYVCTDVTPYPLPLHSSSNPMQLSEVS